MKTSTRTAILIFVYTVFAFAFFVGKAFLIKELPVLMPNDAGMWRFVTGVRAFFARLPAILASVCCIAFSWSFAKDAGKNLARFSPVQLKNYRTVLVASCVSVILCFAGTEILTPIVSAKQTALENKMQDYNWYTEQTKTSVREGNAAAAVFYAENALALWPDNRDAKALYNDSLKLSAQSERKEAEPSSALPSDIATLQNTPYSVMRLLQKAQTAFELKNYFDAHYYAWWGLKLAGDNDANSGELRRIAVESWNIISSWSGFETDDAAMIFLKKREGYSALMEGDALGAYYTFLDLYEANDLDPDILRFYRLATEALLKQYFFIDETRNLAFFENFQNVSFKVTHPDGKTDLISIGGVTTVAKTDNVVKYLRNYSCLAYDEAGHLLYSMTVPYVKLIGQRAGSLGIGYEKRTGIQDAETYVPQLLLTSVDRKNRDIVGSPHYFAAQSAQYEREIVRILPMSLQDFDLACRASAKGPQYMNLAFLFRFVPIAERYGFQKRIFSLFLLQRLCRPLLLLAFFIFLSIIAWNYKLESSQVFRFTWIFSFPVLTAVVQFCMEWFRYLMNLIYYALTGVASFAQLPVVLVVLFVCVILLSIKFLSLHEE